MNPGGVPDYMSGCVGNYANSPLPIVDPSTGAVSGGIRKFVDPLPSIPVAVPDRHTYPGSDYYEISLIETSQKLHSDLPPTRLRIYVQTNNGMDANGANVVPPPAAQYLGPLIIAQKDRPVRVKFTNKLGVGSGGDLFIPVDTTIMGAGTGPDGTSYTQNRANIHLHGGNTPWISDGTPHQWTVPAGDPATLSRGVATTDVPDMPPTGPGEMTLYYTNQQSARLMFYHDHAYGITRLNVYAGAAAGYLLQDTIENTLVNGGTITPPVGSPITVPAGTIPAAQIPLVIQDKTFVPPADQLAAQDPTWNWGPKDTNGNFQTGSFWFPHVYMTNQNPSDDSGANAMGRWDWGPWFWPPMDPSTLLPAAAEWPCPTAANPGQMCPGLPNPSLVPEAFMDTPVVNGAAYPVLHVNPQAYRLRILNASNDRSLNLTLYQAVDNAGAVCTTLPAAPAPGSIASCTEVRQIAPPDGIAGQGPIPDPATKGPQMIQIGTEAGFIPNPVVLDNQPIVYNYNRRDIVVLNVQDKNLWLGPAERADVVVDFSQFAGKTIILYNDSPAPAPAFDTRYDYYTGDPDQTEEGGAPTTLPGYGPNTRTIMQIQVAASGAGAPFNAAPLSTILPAAFAASQPAPIVPEAAYGAAYGTTYPNSYARIQDTSLFTGSLTGISVTAGGSGYTAPPTVVIGAPAAGGTQATAQAVVTAGVVTNIVVTNAGTGYNSTPNVRIVAAAGDTTGTGATAAAVGLPMLRKTIQELFELKYGRMNATLGLELPFTNFNTQTTIPLGYVDPPTESFVDGQPQVWKITHNGVDTHAVHFHLFNVQVINRVGWDGAVRPPDANEIGWKETVKMSPLEDAIVAFLPVKQNLPFSLPDSIHAEDVTMPTGSSITVVNPADGNSTTISNPLLNFGQEYVWHCHLLGHEENDMMRPMIFQVAPEVPSNLAATRVSGSSTAHITFTNNSAAVVQSNSLSSTSTGYTLQRDTTSAFLAPTNIAIAPTLGTPVGSVVNYADTGATSGTTFYYRVQSFTSNGTSVWSNVAQIVNQPDVPVGHLDTAVDSVSKLAAVQQTGYLYVSGWAADPLDGSPLGNIKVNIDGIPVGTVTKGLSRPDVAAFFGNSAYTNSGFSLRYSASSLSFGAHTVTATATNLAGASTNLGSVAITVISTPVGHLDIAADSVTKLTTIRNSGTMYVGGWAADPVDGSPLSNVKVLIDGVSIGTPTLGVSRTDVATSLGKPSYTNSGFTINYPATTLSAGTHAITATATNSAAVTTALGSINITVTDNLPPLGHLDMAVDSVTATTTVSQAHNLYVSGWAADYGDNSPAKVVRVLIDGVAVTSPTLGIARADVASYYGKPTWANAGFTLVMSASTISKGTHVVSAVAYDSLNHSTTLGTVTITVQ